MKETGESWRYRMVVSLAGRDKGTVCLVLQEEDDFLYLTDGRLRPVERPKKKKRKHVRLLADERGKALRFDGENAGPLTNRFVRQWLNSIRETRTNEEPVEQQTGRRSSSG